MLHPNYLKIVFIAILLSSQLSFSQIKIGAKAGYSIGNINDTSDNIYARDYKSTSGVDFGLLAEFPISNDFSIQAELSFTQRGGERDGIQPIPLDYLEDALGNNGLSLDVLNQLIQAQGGAPINDSNPLYADFNNISELEYLEIPILAKYGWGSDWRFYVTGGPYIGILLNANQETSGTSQFYLDSGGTMPLMVPNPFYDGTPANGPQFVPLPAQSFEATTDVKDDLNTFNFGAQGGVGIIRKLAEQHEVFFDFRASYSFIPIQKEEVYGESKIGAFVFSLGYAFTL